jgi:peptidoglycan/LPS O-acetylase OafA/YrhL
MDASLFQFGECGVPLKLQSVLAAGPAAPKPASREPRRPLLPQALIGNSRNLDFLRSYAVILVVIFHLAKFFDWRFENLCLTDFGLLGVMLFFVHTTLVLMFSLERQSAGGSGRLFLPFMIRRSFRIYPLAILVVSCAYLLRIPSDLRFGGFALLHQSPKNLVANLLLIQNVTLQKANPGVLWSLPLELQMYLALPALFLFTSRLKSSWGAVALWWLGVAAWFAVGFSTGMLPLSDGKIRSPIEALLKFTRFAPCFLPGVIAYKLWRLPRLLSARSWPLFLALCSAAFIWMSGKQPIETGWFVCFAIGLGACLFREMPENSLTWATKRIARYSYGIYLVHYFAIWLAFAVCGQMNVSFRIAIFFSVLAGLPVLLYHGVEAPMIAAGVRWSNKIQSRAQTNEQPSGPLNPTTAPASSL